MADYHTMYLVLCLLVCLLTQTLQVQISIVQASSKQVISLHGSMWQLANSNRSILTRASIPGVAHTALLKSNLIRDPYYRFNDVELRWITKEDWTFSRELQVSEEFMKFKKIVLVCEGLDTVSHIEVNGKIVGYADNMFRCVSEYVVDV
jgi:beta-mannosidase